MAIRLRTVVAASSLAMAVFLAASPGAAAIEIGETCPCARSGGGGRCIRVVSARSCAIAPCGPSFKCVPDADSTHMCLAQAGSGQAGKCDGPVSAGQTSCPCTVGAVSGGPPSLVPVQTTPRSGGGGGKCSGNGDCSKGNVCVSGKCEAAGTCTAGKDSECDAAYTRLTGDTNNRAKCCPASSKCVKDGIQAGESTACSTDCGKKCDPFCSLSDINGVSLCSKL